MNNVRDELEVGVDDNDAIFDVDERENHEDESQRQQQTRGPFRGGNGELNRREDGGRDPLREGDARPKGTLDHSEEREGFGQKRTGS